METKAIILWDEDYPVTLSAQQWEDPLTVLDRFFSRYSLQEAQLFLCKSLPLAFTNQVILSPDQRYQLFCLVNHLERLGDAAWVLVNYSGAVPDYTPCNHLKAWIQSDTLSFLTIKEALKPLSTIHQLFPSSWSNSWKPPLLKGLREALFDPLFFITGNSNDLREFTYYVTLNKLLEAAFLLVRNQEPLEASALHCSLQMHQPDPMEWGNQFYTEGGIKKAIESLAFIAVFIKEYMRKRVETTISEIKGLFLRKFHAVTFEGWLLKITLFIFAFTLNKIIP